MNWHERYTQQAGWTAQLRAFLFNRAGVSQAARVLETGCGTGAVLADFGGRTGIHGLDLDRAALREARSHVPGASLCAGDIQTLPYARGVFDAVYCHYTLLWVKDPAAALREMRRVTRPGGCVLALAEPDYGGRVDYPAPLAALGAWQAQALRRQGAQVEMGRRLAGIFSAAGLSSVETGVMGGQWRGAPDSRELDLEWETMLEDLRESAPRSELEELRRIDRAAWAAGTRVLFVPTFYAWGFA